MFFLPQVNYKGEPRQMSAIQALGEIAVLDGW